MLGLNKRSLQAKSAYLEVSGQKLEISPTTGKAAHGKG
jgi:hypothetical protein